jgi:hypothetical protein
VPLPVPVDPLVTLIQLELLVADQAQPASVDRLTVPDPPAAPVEPLDGESEYVQVVPACVTVSVWPATVIVALRCDPAGFAGAENATDPVPLPLAPLVIVSQLAPLVAVHAQPASAETDAVPLPPLEAIATFAGLTV